MPTHPGGMGGLTDRLCVGGRMRTNKDSCCPQLPCWGGYDRPPMPNKGTTKVQLTPNSGGGVMTHLVANPVEMESNGLCSYSDPRKKLVRLPQGQRGQADLRQLPDQEGLRQRGSGPRSRRRCMGRCQPARRARHHRGARRGPAAAGLHRRRDGPSARGPPSAQPGDPRGHALRGIPGGATHPRRRVGQCLARAHEPAPTASCGTISLRHCAARRIR